MPMIRVEMFRGRTVDQKRALAKALTEAFAQTCGGTPQAIHIVIEDIAKDNWAIGGGLCGDLYPDQPEGKK